MKIFPIIVGLKIGLGDEGHIGFVCFFFRDKPIFLVLPLIWS